MNTNIWIVFLIQLLICVGGHESKNLHRKVRVYVMMLRHNSSIAFLKAIKTICQVLIPEINCSLFVYCEFMYFISNWMGGYFWVFVSNTK